jgi:hypothetical protein
MNGGTYDKPTTTAAEKMAEKFHRFSPTVPPTRSATSSDRLECRSGYASVKVQNKSGPTPNLRQTCTNSGKVFSEKFSGWGQTSGTSGRRGNPGNQMAGSITEPAGSNRAGTMFHICGPRLSHRWAFEVRRDQQPWRARGPRAFQNAFFAGGGRNQ